MVDQAHLAVEDRRRQHGGALEVADRMERLCIHEVEAIGAQERGLLQLLPRPDEEGRGGPLAELLQRARSVQRPADPRGIGVARRTLRDDIARLFGSPTPVTVSETTREFIRAGVE